MNDLSLTILPETAKDAQAIERLHERTFGPGRFVLSAYRLREHVDHLLDLSFTARIGTLLVGSGRQVPVLHRQHAGADARAVDSRAAVPRPRRRAHAARAIAAGRQGQGP